MRNWLTGIDRSVMSAMRFEFRIASRWSGKSAAMSAADFSQKSSVSNFIRPGVSRLLPVPTHSSTSCAADCSRWT
jgi:hypothetical protein